MSNTLWYNSLLNTNVASSVFNQLYNYKALEMVRKENGLLYAVLGKTWRDANPKFPVSYERLNRITGNQIQVRLLGALPAPGYVTDGAAELQTVTNPTYSSSYFGAVTADLAHIADVQGIPGNEMDRIAGKEAATKSFVAEVFNMLMLGLEKVIGDDMSGANGVNAPARSSVGSWEWAVSDGTSTNESTYATYLTVDRSQSANADFQSYVDSTTTDLSLSAIRNIKNNVKTKGGNNKLAVANVTQFGQIQGLVEAQTIQNQIDPEWETFGGEYVAYGGTRFILEQRTPAGTLGIFSPDSWGFWMNEAGLIGDGGFMKSPLAKDGYVLPYRAWVQFICTMPRRNGKFNALNV